ncbi:T-complex protein 1 subunit delta [Sesamum angolense]|uniref:T-complex protein 1 subunit delta n=2 Tax=Sesamum TaxID=4181 RepID=A0AAE1VT51_9LAMI|nr:T-complex protein 1 subunit delta [Sesamum angolense]
MAAPAVSKGRSTETFVDNKRKDDIRMANIAAAQSVANAVRTSLGPKGMDKMISTSSGEVIITNDGATILNKMEVLQPAAKFLVELSKSQDVVAGDGTTTVVVIAGSLLKASLGLLTAGIHPTIVSDSLHKTSIKAVEILSAMAVPVELSDRDSLVKSASTSLNSKVVSQYSTLLAPLAVDAVLSVVDPEKPDLVDLKDIKIVKKLGGTVDDTELIKGLVFDKKVSHAAGGPTRVENAKIGKSILRDAVTDLSLHYLAKAKILVIKDVERDEIEFITKTLNCLPISNIEHFRAEKLGYADLVEEVPLGDGGKIVKITGIKNMGRTTSVLVRGSNQLVLDEAERSLHDALCVVRCLVNKKFLIAGGGAPEIELSRQLGAWAKVLQGMEGYCVRAFAEALEVIPYTLAENAGLNPIAIVTELRNRHAQGEINAGINVRKGQITNILEENVVQPLLVSTSAISLATECVRMILKIDDIVTVRDKKSLVKYASGALLNRPASVVFSLSEPIAKQAQVRAICTLPDPIACPIDPGTGPKLSALLSKLRIQEILNKSSEDLHVNMLTLLRPLLDIL